MTNAPRPLFLLLTAGAALIGGCVPAGPFPSLAPRAAEQEDWTIEPVREPVAAQNDAALRARIADLARRAANGARAFDADYEAAGRAMASAGATGSDSWVMAQQAFSRLEASRAETMAALADLEALSLERADIPTSEEDRAALDAAIAEAGRIAAGQQARLDRIRRD